MSLSSDVPGYARVCTWSVHVEVRTRPQVRAPLGSRRSQAQPLHCTLTWPGRQVTQETEALNTELPSQPPAS